MDKIEQPDAWDFPLAHWYEANLSYEALEKHKQLNPEDLKKFHQELARREAEREAELTDDEVERELNRLTNWGKDAD